MGKSGPKPKYATDVQPRLETIRAWRRCGLTHEEIYANLRIGSSAFYMYKARYQELFDALRVAADDANAQVVNALFKRAVGYEYEEKKTIQEIGSEGKPSGKRIEITQKQMPPDVGAIVFYLKNRYGAKWRDRIPEGDGDIGTPPTGGATHIGDVNVNVTQNIGEGQLDAEQIKSKARDILSKHAKRFDFRSVEPPGSAD